MAIGMGVPLLVVGASAGQLLPRAGAWMDTVKQVFGAMMLAVAVWMLSRILPERITLALWALPLLALAIIFWVSGVKGSGTRIAVARRWHCGRALRGVAGRRRSEGSHRSAAAAAGGGAPMPSCPSSASSHWKI